MRSRRRVQLVKKPAVLILDEPTSGLDSASAYGVMLRLCELAKAGHAVACTIHQPSTEIWDLFDKLHLLSAGHTVYSGAASRARDYFAAAGHPCPQYANPADHFLALVNGDFPDRYDASLLQHFADSDERRTLLKKVAKAAQAGAAAPLGGADAPSGLRHLSTFVTLCHRFTLNNLRNPGSAPRRATHTRGQRAPRQTSARTHCCPRLGSDPPPSRPRPHAAVKCHRQDPCCCCPTHRHPPSHSLLGAARHVRRPVPHVRPHVPRPRRREGLLVHQFAHLAPLLHCR